MVLKWTEDLTPPSDFECILNEPIWFNPRFNRFLYIQTELTPLITARVLRWGKLLTV
jgi:hypothetical protein